MPRDFDNSATLPGFARNANSRAILLLLIGP